MKPGEFSPEARAAIYEAAGYRCVGCGNNQPLTCQHRIARGMGGTSNNLIGHPSNGVALCGSGTTGCHGWTEAHPKHAGALGWRVSRHEDPGLIPWWTQYGWRCWQADLTVIALPDMQTMMARLLLDSKDFIGQAIDAYCADRMVML